MAGSTGSRGTTFQLMLAIAGLPQGAVVLPGFDFDMPSSVWDKLSDPNTGEDHPQFRFSHLLNSLGIKAKQVEPWTGGATEGRGVGSTLGAISICSTNSSQSAPRRRMS